MNIAVIDGELSAAEAYLLMKRMADSGRYLRLPKSAAELRR